MKVAFDRIKEEFQEHLDTINMNTNEISANYEYIFQLEARIDKLNEKLDEVLMHINTSKGPCLNKASFSNVVLSPREQEIMLLLYARNGDLIEAKEIAKLLGLTEDKVDKHITSLGQKGIPVEKRYSDGRIYLILDYEFRNLQAKENVIKINESIVREMHNSKII